MMSHEGTTSVARIGLVVLLTIAASIFSVLIGPGKRKGRFMLAGTLGGVTFGVLVASPISHWFRTETSAVCASLGMVLGWGVSWLFARRLPREAH